MQGEEPQDALWVVLKWDGLAPLALYPSAQQTSGIGLGRLFGAQVRKGRAVPRAGPVGRFPVGWDASLQPLLQLLQLPGAKFLLVRPTLLVSAEQFNAGPSQDAAVGGCFALLAAAGLVVLLLLLALMHGAGWQVGWLAGWLRPGCSMGMTTLRKGSR